MDLVNYVCDWEMSMEETMSDHRQIQFRLRMRKPCRNLQKPPNTDWNLFISILSQLMVKRIARIKTVQDNEAEVTCKTAAVQTAYRSAWPEKAWRPSKQLAW